MKNKGITLVSLVITIIILLILAGVSIRVLTGGEILFGKTKEAVEKYNNEVGKEAQQINVLINEIGNNGKEISEPVPDATNENLSFINTPNVWTNEDVQVSIETTIQGYKLQYSLDEGNIWCDYVDNILVTKNNQIILARFSDGKQNGELLMHKVENIDTLNPNNSAINVNNITTTTATLIATGSEAEATVESGKSGINRYIFYVDGNEYKRIDTTNQNANITLGFLANSHNCFVRIYDLAGNYKDSNTITVNKHVHNAACYSNIVCGAELEWVAGMDGTLKYCNSCGTTYGDGYSHVLQTHCTKVTGSRLICNK